MSQKLVYFIGGTRYKAGKNFKVGELVEIINKKFKDESKDIVLEHFCVDEVEYFYTPGNASLSAKGVDLTKADLIVFRGGIEQYPTQIAMIRLVLDKLNIPYFNTMSQDVRSSNKALQSAMFFKYDMPFPSTYYAEPGIFFANVDTHFEYPFIIKDTNAGHGLNNYLVKNREEVDAIQADPAVADREFLAQEFIKNDGDFRVFLMGEKCLPIHRVGDGSSHLNNTSRGGSGTIVDESALPEKALIDAKEIAKNFGYVMAGVDVIIDSDSGDYYFLELNSQPQIMTGAVVDSKLSLFTDLIESYLH